MASLQGTGATFTIDDHEMQAFMRRYTPREIDKVMQLAAAAGARAGAKVARAAAPEGTSKRMSQYYRARGGQHGNFKRSVRAGRIRHKFDNQRTIGYVVGPTISPNRSKPGWGFTRSWIEAGTKPHGSKGRNSPGRNHMAANPWFERVMPSAKSAAEAATRKVIEAKARG